MKSVTQFMLFILVNAFLHGAKPYKNEEKIDLPNGLKVGDLLEWKGRISGQKNPSNLYLNSFIDGDETLLYSVMKLQLQGARNRFTVWSGKRNAEKQHQVCTLGQTLVAPNMEFWLILRFFEDKIFVYWNGDLKYTLPQEKSGDDPESLGAIRTASLSGTHHTERFQLLTNETMAKIMESKDCGFVTPGKKVPEFCESKPEGTPSCRVVGGGPAIPGMQPWQASIRKKPHDNTGEQSHVCGATLIGDCWAIAAQHCFFSQSTTSWDNLLVRVGDYYNEDNSPYSRYSEAESSLDIEIAHVYGHSDYKNLQPPRNDIALIKLQQCVTNFNDFVRPACLPQSSHQFKDGTNCGISGWGAYNSNPIEYPKCLHTTGVKLIDSTTCQQAYQEKNFDPELMFCAGSRCMDACHKDSGGPLVCPQPSGARFTLWGITSWGEGCGNPEKPGVYTRLAKYIPWIFHKMFLVEDAEIENRIKNNMIPKTHCQHNL